MHSQVEQRVHLARGSAEVDVVAVETIEGRANTIFCECKQWTTSIPQQVVHGFRTVVADGGANVGYIITSSAFQRGALSAADLTNLRLLTWEEFQAEFETTWIERHLRPLVTKRLDGLMSLTEPLLPSLFDDLSDSAQVEYLAAREKYFDLGALSMLFTTYIKFLSPTIPALPLRDRFQPSSETTEIPDAVLDATGYRDLLDVLIPFGESAAAELRAILHRDDRPDSAER
jgi:hypothetical protein